LHLWMAMQAFAGPISSTYLGPSVQLPVGRAAHAAASNANTGNSPPEGRTRSFLTAGNLAPIACALSARSAVRHSRRKAQNDWTRRKASKDNDWWAELTASLKVLTDGGAPVEGAGAEAAASSKAAGAAPVVKNPGAIRSVLMADTPVKLEAKAAKLKADANMLREKLTEAAEMGTKQTARMDELQQKLEDSEVAECKTTEKLKQLESTLRDTTDKLNSTSSKYSESKAKMEKLTNDLDRIKAEEVKLMDDLESAISEIAASEKDATEAKLAAAAEVEAAKKDGTEAKLAAAAEVEAAKKDARDTKLAAAAEVGEAKKVACAEVEAANEALEAQQQETLAAQQQAAKLAADTQRTAQDQRQKLVAKQIELEKELKEAKQVAEDVRKSAVEQMQKAIDEEGKKHSVIVEELQSQLGETEELVAAYEAASWWKVLLRRKSIAKSVSK